jgi:hypothetical protein
VHFVGWLGRTLRRLDICAVPFEVPDPAVTTFALYRSDPCPNRALSLQIRSATSGCPKSEFRSANVLS